MNWRTEAIEKLQGYAGQKAALSEIPERIRQLESAATLRAVESVERVQASGDGHGRETVMINSLAAREELARQLEIARVCVALVDNALARLDEDDRLVLDRFYIHRQKRACERLCEELDREPAQIYRRRDRALRYFTIALYGAE